MQHFTTRQVVSLVAQLAAYVCGAFVAILLLMTFGDSTLLITVRIYGRTLLWWLAIFSGALAVSRAFIPDKKVPYNPARWMAEVVKYTHYYPHRWRVATDAKNVYSEFSQLFKMSFIVLLQVSRRLDIFSSSHLLIFSSSHLLIFSSSHLLFFSSSHLLIFSSSHLLIFSSSHLLIFSSSHILIFSSSLLFFSFFSLSRSLSLSNRRLQVWLQRHLFSASACRSAPIASVRSCVKAPLTWTASATCAPTPCLTTTRRAAGTLTRMAAAAAVVAVVVAVVVVVVVATGAVRSEGTAAASAAAAAAAAATTTTMCTVPWMHR
jgi:hypothetical protein